MIKKALILASVLLIFSMSYFFYWFGSPNPLNYKETEYILKEGSTFTRVVYSLEKEDVLSHPNIFIYYAKIIHLTGNLKVGTYLFPKGISPKQVLFKLVFGDIVTIKVTIPEGLNIYQSADVLSQYFYKIDKKEWIKIAHSQELIRFLGYDLNIKNLEGFLFPETYIFDPNLAPIQVIKALIIEFKKNISIEMFAKAKKLGLSPIQYITLASIVEKETGVSRERERVAGVYWNRLKIKMKLQADPTVIYGMGAKYKGKITKKDLLTPTPYNTYTNYGLPPGPIASPGKASLKAILNPTLSQELYFVAKGDGSHVFSHNLAEHNKAVKKYIIFLKASKHRE